MWDTTCDSGGVRACITIGNMLDSVCKVGLKPSKDNAIKASMVFQFAEENVMINRIKTRANIQENKNIGGSGIVIRIQFVSELCFDLKPDWKTWWFEDRWK